MTAKNVKILLLDDSEVMARHVSALLGQKQWQVVTASNLAAAVEAFYKHRPDALLLDFVLEGGQTGLAALTAIFALCDASQGTPQPVARPAAAILTQGALAPGDQQKAKTLGAPVLQKPVYGQEHDFLMSVTLWLKAAGLI